MQCRFVLLVLAWTSSLSAQDNLLDNPERWTISPDGGAFVPENGEQVLQLTGGAAQLNGLAFESGTIEFEMQLTPLPAFVGVRFRAGDSGAEHVYFRPHRSGFWDAIQYQPIMNGSTTWQLYQVEGYSQAAALPAAEWIPVRLVVNAGWAELYVGSPADPTMRLTLQHGVASGALAFTAGFRDGNADHATAGAFRRLRVTPSPSRDHGSGDDPVPSDDFIRTWMTSDPYPVDALPVTETPSALRPRHTVTAEKHGVINLNRYYQKIPGSPRSAVTAEVTLEADRAMRVPLAIDYSDDVSVFHDGDLLFSGVNGWQSRYPYYLGGLMPQALTNTVWLNLRPGANRLTLVVSDEAFGWGFVASLRRADGLRVMAR